MENMDFIKFLEEEENRKKGIQKPAFSFQQPQQSPVTKEALAPSPFSGTTTHPPTKGQAPANTTGSASLQPQPLMPKQQTIGSSTTKNQVLPTPQEAGLAAERQNIFEDQAAVIDQQSELAKSVARAEADAASQKANELAKSEEHQKVLARARQQAEAEAFENLQQKQKEVEGLKIQDYWSTKTTGDKVIASVGLLVSAIGAGATGKENMAAKALADNIDKDFAIQKANIDNAFQSLQQEGYNLQQLKNMNDRVQQDFDLVKSSAYAKLQATLEANLKKLGVSQAEIDKNATLNELRAKKNAIDQQLQESLRQSVNTNVQQQMVFESQEPVTEDDRFGRITRGDLTREEILNFVDEKDQSEALKEYGQIQKARRISNRVDELLDQQDAQGGIMDRVKGEKLKGEIAAELKAYIMNAQRTPEEKNGRIEQVEQALNVITLDTRADIEDIRGMAQGIVQNLTDTPLLDGYGIRPPLSITSRKEVEEPEPSAVKTDGRLGKKEVKRQRNTATGQIKIIYDDGSQEIL